MALAIRLAADPVRTLAFGSVVAGYTRITYGAGDTGMTKPVRMFVIQNLTDALLMFSLDGVNDHLPLGATSYMILDVTANNANAQSFFLAERQNIYVKRIGIPTMGSVYITVFYGAE